MPSAQATPVRRYAGRRMCPALASLHHKTLPDPTGPGADFRSEQAHDQAILVRGPNGSVAAQKRCPGALLQGPAITGAVNGYVFTGQVPGSRPASDFTVRVAPRRTDAFIPAELALIAWQR